MSSNPFKIIEPTEKAPENMKGELMGSIDNVVLMLRFVQLFVADSTAVALTKMKIDLDKSESNSKNPEL
ncbi:MAG: hypothetical protein HKO93_03685 [Flavobacteriales bacterium]|nr:hypothetical protein [Flavobacteriales bacterium]